MLYSTLSACSVFLLDALSDFFDRPKQLRTRADLERGERIWRADTLRYLELASLQEPQSSLSDPGLADDQRKQLSTGTDSELHGHGREDGTLQGVGPGPLQQLQTSSPHQGPVQGDQVPAVSIADSVKVLLQEYLHDFNDKIVWLRLRLFISALGHVHGPAEAKLPPRKQPVLGARCFLVMDSKSLGGPYAKRVPLRRQPRGDSEAAKGNLPVENFTRLRAAYFAAQGRWKQWLPFYDVVEVKEVNFSFADAVDQYGRNKICYENPLDTNKMIETAQEIIDDRRRRDERGDDFCEGFNDHEPNCPSPFGKCIEHLVSEAHEHLKRLKRLHEWKDCLRNPHKAKGINTFDGLAQESPVYTKKMPIPRSYGEVNSAMELRGLYVRFGWQIADWQHASTKTVLWMWLAIAVIWLGTFVWAEQKGDWSTAMGFGQLLAASIALVSFYAKD
ncbi:hypothetical protein LTR85_000347 [Meristemomyces frigidus]|nr:hypothetical protein LTR85_000347 [Meristemomyces frigidus]